jgi:amino acid adenylation domain-containing protein
MRPFHLADLVPRAAERDPDRPAVRAAGESVSAAALAARVDGLAATLAGSGVRRGDRVGVLVRKSAETVVAVHGVLAAGAVSVALDPLAPAAYVRRLVEDCDVRVVVSDDAGRSTLERVVGGGSPLRQLVGPSEGVGGVSSIPWDETRSAGPHARPRILGDDAAYILYTSGSTGTPKGIVHTHRSGLRYAELAVETYGLRPEDRLANIAPLHFDQSTFELFAGPLAGACTVVVPEAHVRMPASLTALVAEERATVWYSVPSLLGAVLHRGALEQRDLSSLRWVLFGGEVFPPGALRELMVRWPHARFSNVYGPAEVNQCTFHHLDAPPCGDDPVPIGRPWPDTEVLVVDADGSPVPSGVPGHLLVRTATAMAGYWGGPDPFVVRAGRGGPAQRWYPTGDLVEERPDGELVFLGRADNQVKVRGHRIELEGLEATIADLPGVAEAVVAVTKGATGDDELVAAVVPAPGAVVDDAGLRRRLATVLPSYAVPVRFDDLGPLARTSAGKIDRRTVRASLQRPATEQTESQGTRP